MQPRFPPPNGTGMPMPSGMMPRMPFNAMGMPPIQNNNMQQFYPPMGTNMFPPHGMSIAPNMMNQPMMAPAGMMAMHTPQLPRPLIGQQANFNHNMQFNPTGMALPLGYNNNQPQNLAQVIVSAPVLRNNNSIQSAPQQQAPTQGFPHMMAIYNASLASIQNTTSNLLNQHIFSNPIAGSPLTLYIGNLPLDIEEVKLSQLLEACGKVTKWVRPIDPLNSSLPKSFGFVTYAQGICALRCYNIFNNISVEPQMSNNIIETNKIDSENDMKIENESKSLDSNNNEDIIGINESKLDINNEIVQTTATPEAKKNPIKTIEINIKLTIKTGIKETVVIEQLQSFEQEAVAQLPEGRSIMDVYNPIRENMSKILTPITTATVNNNAEIADASATATISSSSKDEDKESSLPAAVLSQLKSASGLPLPVPASLLPIGEMEFLDDDEEEAKLAAAALDAGEKMLLSQITQFRQRQQLRDKEVEEQRRNKIKNKIKELNEKRLQQQSLLSSSQPPPPPAPPSANTSNNNSNNLNEANANDNNDKRRRDADRMNTSNDADDLEARKRRKLQVLKLLSEDADPSVNNIDNIDLSSDNPMIPPAPMPPRMKLVQPVKVGLNLTNTKSKLINNSNYSNNNNDNNNVNNDDDYPTQREVIKLDYTDEELKQSQQIYASSHINDDDDNEGLDGNYKRKSNNNVIVPTNIQQKVLAQAQAISASLVAQNNVTSTASVSAKQSAGTLDSKALMKQLVEKIPTTRNELFAYELNWNAIEKHKIISNTMKSWVVKKIVEYLGEEEESLTTFIIMKLNSRCQPQELLEELSMVLDEDSEQFVLKLWRMLIFYSLKVQHD
eukprot:gene8587-11602_t